MGQFPLIGAKAISENIDNLEFFFSEYRFVQ